MKKKLNLPVWVLSVIMVLASCEKEETVPEKRGYAAGVIITNEGAFNSSNGSISWYSPDSAMMVNNIFESVNGRPPGDVVQSFSRAGDYGVIVVNNSNKIEIVDLETFESTGTITGFTYPRYFEYSGNGTGYLSNGSGAGEVYKIDLQNATVTDTIEVGMGPEKMVISGNLLYVANSGGWAFDNTVSVIDTGTGEIAGTVTAGDVPVSLVKDKNGDVWVLCRGKVVYNETWTEIIDETNSKLVRISGSTGMADREVIIGQKGDYFNPSWLSANHEGDMLYYGEADGIYAMGIDRSIQPEHPVIAGQFSAAAAEPGTGIIYALEITGYSSSGKLHIFKEGSKTATWSAGIAPNGLSLP